VKGIKEQKIRINSFKGTLLMDLLEHARKLASRGKPEYNAHIQTLTQINQPTKNNEQPNNNSPLLISGVVILVVVLALGIGYRLGRKARKTLNE
jgi:hypothetical protein